MDARLTNVRLDVAANALHLTWSDGRNDVMSGGWLRFICPCAECRGHAPGEVEPPAWDRCKDVRVTHVEGVGNYALRFTLSDGHASGIHTFDLLRKNPPTPPDA